MNPLISMNNGLIIPCTRELFNKKMYLYLKNINHYKIEFTLCSILIYTHMELFREKEQVMVSFPQGSVDEESIDCF